MRHNNSGRRSRKRNNGNRGGNARTRVYDSNGPDVRIRGTAYQVADKYEALAKDAMSAGDIVLAQSYLQHAEHYRRIIGEFESSDISAKKGSDTNVRHKNKAGGESYNTKSTEKTLPGMSDNLDLPSSILGKNDAATDSTEMATA
jgi:hypothetical protein